jgi:hypothetical protein
VAALHERLILLSPSLYAQASFFFSCRETEKVKKTLQRWGGSLARQRKLFREHSLGFSRGEKREGKRRGS